MLFRSGIVDCGSSRQWSGVSDRCSYSKRSGIDDRCSSSQWPGISDRCSYSQRSSIVDCGSYSQWSGIGDRCSYSQRSGIVDGGSYSQWSGISDRLVTGWSHTLIVIDLRVNKPSHQLVTYTNSYRSKGKQAAALFGHTQSQSLCGLIPVMLLNVH